MRYYTYFSFLLLVSFSAGAQKDTSKNAAIDIISSYKPVLRNAAKINLSASPLEADTSTPHFTYTIPPINLAFNYQPIALKPLALNSDSSLPLGIRNYVKFGFGNYSTPYLRSVFGFGNGRKFIANLYGNYISSKGKMEYQDFSDLSMKALGSYFFKGKELHGAIGVGFKEYFQYGFDSSQKMKRDSLRRQYSDVMLQLGFRNTATNKLNINYDPTIDLHFYTRENKIQETDIELNIPVQKKLNDQFTASLVINSRVANYTNKDLGTAFTINNSVFELRPALDYYNSKFIVHAGLTPAWDNKEFTVLPDFRAEVPIATKNFVLQAGWVGRFINNSFRTLTKENPYIADPFFLANTKEQQFYGGIKTSIGNHFDVNAKAAILTYHNVPLFVNDFDKGNTILVVNERRINDLQIHGDVIYTKRDAFSVKGALDLNTYSGLKDNANAWHLIPVQLTGSFRWNAYRHLLLKSDLFMFSNVPVLLKHNVEAKLPAAVDLSAGAEYSIRKNIGVWLTINNLLNKRYERWNNYQVYGTQVLAGFLFHF
jgi:hypothetical protein